jgi:hypothetical protein
VTSIAGRGGPGTATVAPSSPGRRMSALPKTSRNTSGKLRSCAAAILGSSCPLWVISGLEAPPSDVRFTPKSGHWLRGPRCPLCAKSRHRQNRSIKTGLASGLSPVFGDPHLYQFRALLFRMRRPEIWELLEDVGVRLEARGRALIFRQEGQAVLDHVIGEDPTVRILCGFRWIET